NGHGSGAVGDFLGSNRHSATLSIPDLGFILKEVPNYCKKGRLDILGLDTCLMSMAEVGYEVRESVRYLVAAQGFEPNTGWPWGRIASFINSIEDPEDNRWEPKNFAQELVREYIKYYFDYRYADISTDQ